MSITTTNTTSRLAVIAPDQPGYDPARGGWNLAIDHKPALIALPDDEDGVAEAVNIARDRNLPIAVQATGHGQAAPADNAMLVNTSRLNRFEIDPAAATARINAGVRWDRVIPEAARHGLAPLVGSTPDLSAVGYLTGGGLPVLGRQFGFAADHIRSFRIVTADGVVRNVTPGRQPDLFWAVRGGKDNFGIVTSVTIDLLPLNRLYGGTLTFPGHRAREILTTWLAWTRHIGSDMSTSVALIQLPGDNGLPATSTVQVRIAWTGDVTDGERMVAPVRDLGAIQDTVTDLPYERIGEIHADPLEPMPVRDWGTLLRDLDEATIDRLIDVFIRSQIHPPGLIEIRRLGGDLGQEPAVPNAIGHRHAAFTFVSGMLALSGDEDRVTDTMVLLEQALATQDLRAAFPSFLSSGNADPDHVRRAYAPDDYTMLAALKHAWDPGNLFRLNHNIPPRAPE